MLIITQQVTQGTKPVPNNSYEYAYNKDANDVPLCNSKEPFIRIQGGEPSS